MRRILSRSQHTQLPRPFLITGAGSSTLTPGAAERLLSAERAEPVCRKPGTTISIFFLPDERTRAM